MHDVLRRGVCFVKEVEVFLVRKKWREWKLKTQGWVSDTLIRMRPGNDGSGTNSTKDIMKWVAATLVKHTNN